MSRQSRRFTSSIICIACITLLTLCVPALAQQPPEKPVALVRVSDFANSQSSNYLIHFDGAGNQVGPKTSLDLSVQDMLVSDDGQWVALSRTDPNTQATSLEYRATTAAQPIVVRADKSGNGYSINFSRDSRYLLYGTVVGDPPNMQWQAGVIELASGARAEYVGKVIFAANPTATMPTGMLWPIDFNGSRLLFLTVPPATEGYPTGLYSVDLSGFKAGQNLALPSTAKTWHSLPTMLGNPQLSPDGNRLLYLFNNPDNPPVNYEPAGPGGTFNGLAVIDLNAGTDTIVAQAGKGQSLEIASWWYTGDYAIFTGGSYQHSDRVISPRFYSVDVTTGQVTNTPPIFFRDNPQESVIGMLACSSGLFYVTQIGQNPGAETLYVSPLKDPHAGKALLSGANMHFDLRKCLPAQ